MTISQAIEKLQGFLKEVGDVEVIMLTDIDGRFAIDWSRDLDIIELPDDDDNMHTVCAFMESVDENEMTFPKLRRVK